MGASAGRALARSDKSATRARTPSHGESGACVLVSASEWLVGAYRQQVERVDQGTGEANDSEWVQLRDKQECVLDASLDSSEARADRHRTHGRAIADKIEWHQVLATSNVRCCGTDKGVRVLATTSVQSHEQANCQRCVVRVNLGSTWAHTSTFWAPFMVGSMTSAMDPRRSEEWRRPTGRT
eukprot:1702535-Pleurochrysis_carterae.AAC.2